MSTAEFAVVVILEVSAVGFLAIIATAQLLKLIDRWSDR